MWVAWVGSLSWEDPKEKGEATHSSILPWRIPCSVEPMGSQRVGHDWATWLLLTSHSAVAQKRGVSAPSRHPERMPKPCLYSVGQRPAAPRKKTSMRRGRNNHARQGKTWTRTAQGRCVFSHSFCQKGVHDRVWGWIIQQRSNILFKVSLYRDAGFLLIRSQSSSKLQRTRELT